MESKTPFASIRRIVRVRPETFKYAPVFGLSARMKTSWVWSSITQGPTQSPHSNRITHHQGVPVIIGNLRGLGTFVPNQDKNKRFVNTPLLESRSLQELPAFSHPQLVTRSSTVCDLVEQPADAAQFL